MKTLTFTSLLILASLQAIWAQGLLPPAGVEIKGAELKKVITRMETAGLKELKTPQSVVKLSDLTALSASSARFVNSSGIGKVALADLPDTVKKQIGFDAAIALEHDQAKAAMVEKATGDAAKASQEQRNSVARAGLREKLTAEVKAGSIMAEVEVIQTLNDGVKMEWLPTDRDVEAFTPKTEGFLIGDSRRVADGEKFTARMYPAGRYKAKRAIGGAEIVMRAWTLSAESAVARLESGVE